ncbi:hypothetical protein HGRIS_005111 [Hohenbuehelia grisea]|uniref:Uncharacterized protein n=1 Tax=Hohenbuehelia grisea TaxID=104357 RepID=A0ABR3JFL7_9AGAR
MPFPVYLKTGDEVKVNDHVYCSPVWAVRDGTPYSIGRIMEFLPPEGTNGSKETQTQPYMYTRVRIAWYYRPSDVSDRAVNDPRLVLAAMYSEVIDINQIRAKCHVIHRDKISDLAGWKKRPDRFYFNRLFDPYIKKEFEVIQATDVRNLPENIRETLISRYEYVVTEKEVVPDLTDALRLCDTCVAWCETPETVQCDRCKKYFHMLCVQPPLMNKPSRGYGWTCAPCSRKHEEEVDSHDVRHSTPITTKPKSNAPAPRGRGRPRKDRSQAEREENLQIKHFNMWPYRYFGQYTKALDTLDPDDLIFPRIATRQGPKFQASVPPAPDLNTAAASDPDERGGDNTIEILSVINTLTDAEVTEMEDLKKGLTKDVELLQSVDWLTEVIKRFSDAIMAVKPLSSVNMKSVTRLEKWKKHETRYTDREWTPSEVAAFEDGIMTHNAELRAVREEVSSRSMPEVVRFYGHWKNSKLGEENERIREQGKTPEIVGKKYKSVEEARNGQRVGLADEEESLVTHPPKTSMCGACRTRDSKVWWRAPKNLATSILCDSCGLNWRKYADLNVRPPIREESLPVSKARALDKREGTPLQGPSSKRAKTSASTQSTPPPAQAHVPQVRCMACHENGPVGKVLKCKECGVRVHAGTGGAVVEPGTADRWICELCQNEETLEASIYTDCLLCPRPRKNDRASLIPDGFLRICKPTEGQGWVHVLCSVFVPELTYTDAARLRLVEGISTISPHRWSTKCYSCGKSDGAVVRCSGCTKEYHVSCAWKHDLKFGFEMQPVKTTRRDTTITTIFQGQTGCMTPVLLCKEHDTTWRKIYDLCDVDHESGETAIQVYSRIYKQAAVGQAHGLLRKARRLDAILALTRLEPASAAPPAQEPLADAQCYSCFTEYSPAFYRIGGNTAKVECHQCHIDCPADPSPDSDEDKDMLSD